MKEQFVVRLTRSRMFLIMVVVGLLVALVAQLVPASTSNRGAARTLIHQSADTTPGGEIEAGRQGDGIAQQQYSNRAYPHRYIAFEQRVAARNAYLAIPAASNPRLWQEIGPFTPQKTALATYTGRPTTISGRETAVAVAPDCAVNHNCRVWVAAAGGGIWRTDNGLAPKPQWFPSSNGLTSNAIGSILIDPTDPTANTLYVGTGEGNSSADSEAGVGLFKSTDGGRNWMLLPGSVAVSKDRSISSIAVDPANSQHIFIGVAVGIHGLSSVEGGEDLPPSSVTRGLYESTDGGTQWTLAFDLPQLLNAFDIQRAGVSKIELDRTGLSPNQPTRVFASFSDYGLYRRDPVDDGDTNFHQVFTSAGGGNPANGAARTEFSLAPMANGKLRIYLADTDGNPKNSSGDSNADFYSTDNGTKPGLSGKANPGPYGDWNKLSSPTKGTPGYGSFNFCRIQCFYDMAVFSPKGYPDYVYLGGQMFTRELGRASNGRTVQRSVDGGVHFTDMTNDSQSPAEGLHADQHGMAFVPNNPNIGFFASDGGLARINGTFNDHSGDCSSRGLAAADLADCQMWLEAIPDINYSLNDGLRTLQFQSVSLNPQDPLRDVIGGTQDNGTLGYYGSNAWTQFIGGDGGTSGIDVGSPNMRIHTYFTQRGDVNFQGNNPATWDWVMDPIFFSPENSSFYMPVLTDPKVSGTIFAGNQHVWRTQDFGGNQAFLDYYCNEYYGYYSIRPHPCGDWVPIGQDQSGGNPFNFVAAVARTSSDTGTLWSATAGGRVWVSKNADAAAAGVTFDRIDNNLGVGSAVPPHRFVSGIAIDAADPNHALISYSGYGAYTPSTPGHVYEAYYNPTTHKGSFTDMSYNLGDMPITGIQRDDKTGDLYAATDFGVLILPSGSTTWQVAANGIPPAAVYGITIDTAHRVLYAATHGRGVFRLYLP